MGIRVRMFRASCFGIQGVMLKVAYIYIYMYIYIYIYICVNTNISGFNRNEACSASKLAFARRPPLHMAQGVVDQSCWPVVVPQSSSKPHTLESQTSHQQTHGISTRV